MRLFQCVRRLLPAFMLLLVLAPVGSVSGQGLITVNVAPPALPVYEQPPCPDEGWMWTPGYWAWDNESGYYWVPGEWVPAPYEGALWTPPWWGWESGRYMFHQGYWGDDVGYYGGINYGYGYMGLGFVGGEWRNGRFAYNTAVMRVNPRVIHDTYVNETIVRNNTIEDSRRVAFNGGPNGVRHEPTPVERRAMSVRHTAPTQVQEQRVQESRTDRNSFAKVNGGRPHTPAVASPPEATHNAARPEAAAPVRGESRTPESRTTPETRTEPGRPESRPAPAERPRTETRPEPTPRTEAHPASPTHTESRPAPEPRTESRPAPTERPRTEPRPAPESHPTEPRPIPERESHPAPPPRTESRPAPEPHTESRPVQQRESRPQPAPHVESHPAPQRESHPAPPPREEKPKQPEK